MKLYHYTCRHRAALIGRAGTLQPYPHPMIPARSLVWLTDLPEPDAERLGLTSHTLTCDRTEVRYVVDRPDTCITWAEWAEGRHVLRSTRSELTFGKAHARWWVSEHPLTARRA